MKILIPGKPKVEDALKLSELLNCIIIKEKNSFYLSLEDVEDDSIPQLLAVADDLAKLAALYYELIDHPINNQTEILIEKWNSLISKKYKAMH